MIDANLTQETVSWIADNVTAPLYADPVSAAKADRLKPVLGKLTAFKPNEYEAKSMTGESTSLFAAEALLNAGVKKVFVSLGGDGIVAASDGEIIKLPCVTTEISNCTGCGDAATAGDNLGRSQRTGHCRKRIGRHEGRCNVRSMSGAINPELCPELIS